MFIDPDLVRQQFIQYWWLIALSVSTSVAGQTVIKLGIGHSGAALKLTSLFLLILKSPLIMIGLFLYGVGALAWIAVLSRLDLSVAYPFLSLNFVLIALVSQLILGEAVPLMRWCGIGFICVGILVIAQSMVTK